MSQESKNYSTIVSQNIKYWREASGLSQELLGKMIGVSESAISLYENGKREPDIEMLGKLAEALCLNITELFLSLARKSFLKRN